MNTTCRHALIAVALGAALPATAPAAEDRGEVFRIGPVALAGTERGRIEFGLGAFDVLRQGTGTRDRTASGQVQVRFAQKFRGVGTTVGLMANAEGSIFGYGGFYADFVWGNVVITPVLGLGGYSRGEGKNLGGVFQFRTAIGAAWEFGRGGRLGIRVSHISNAGIHDRNPGEEEVMLTWSVPF